MSPVDSSSALSRLHHASDSIAEILLGQRAAVRLAVASIIARGHVLFEDVPGVGKTTMAKALARVLGAKFSRIQFTADMLPGDVLGVPMQNRQTGELEFHPGPIFADVVLADEINRASPRTQSAMLEAMAERVVTVDGVAHPLSPTFTVLATQNPFEHHGAYPLPESQLDRFMVRIALGYPAAAEERRLLLAPQGPERAMTALAAALTLAELSSLHTMAQSVKLSEPVAGYLLTLIAATRSHPEIALGASPRAGIAFASVVRSWALLAGRDYVTPDDVRDLLVPVLGHRIVLKSAGIGEGQRASAARVLHALLESTPVPR